MKTNSKVHVNKRSALPRFSNLKTASALAVLAVCFLMHGPPKAVAQAPSAITGTAFSGLVTAATTPPWAPPGSRWLMMLDSSGNGYQVRGIWQVASYDSGTYSYSASGAIGTANFADNALGPLTGTFNFVTVSTGTLHMTNPPYYMESDFELFSGAAPASVAGNSYYLQIEDGAVAFSATGSALLKIAPAGTTYEIVGDGVNTPSSSGTYSYSRLNTGTGSLLLNDSATGNSTTYLSFSNSVAGGFAVTKPYPGGFMVGHFIQVPTLSIAFQGSNVVLSWPTNFTGYTLQSTIYLGAAGWTSFNLAAPPVISNGQYVVTIPNTTITTNAHQYYRLWKQ